MQQCMADRGWHIELGSTGWSAEVPDEQREQFEETVFACQAQFGGGGPPQLSRAEAEEFYDDMVATGECLEELGYPVPEPASRQATIEALMDKGLPPWSPYDYVNESVSSISKLEEIESACPPPWDIVRVGGE